MGLDIYFIKRKRRSGDASSLSYEDEFGEELLYFRKVNFLVAFFENNYNFDREDCEIEFTYNMCCNLINACKKVKENPENADVYLPTTPGFFFGSISYDDYYFNCVDEVLSGLEDFVKPEYDKLSDDEEIIFYISW